MDMEVRFEIIAKRVENEDHAKGKFLFLGEDVVNDFGSGVQEEFLTFRVVDEELPEFMGKGEDDVSMIAVKEFRSEGLRPDVGMFFATARAGFAFTTERDDFGFATVRADEGGEAAVFSAAVKHFLGFVDDMCGELILVELLKKEPVVIESEDRFKGKFFAHNSRNCIRKIFDVGVKSHESR